MNEHHMCVNMGVSSWAKLTELTHVCVCVCVVPVQGNVMTD